MFISIYWSVNHSYNLVFLFFTMLDLCVYCSDSFHQGTQITKGNTWIKTLNIVFESLRFGISVLCVKNATNNETKTKNALIKNAKVLSFSISRTTKFQPPFQLSIGLRRQRRWWGRWGMGVGHGLGLWLGLRLGVMRRSNFSTRRFKLSSVRAEFFWLVSFFGVLLFSVVLCCCSALIVVVNSGWLSISVLLLGCQGVQQRPGRATPTRSLQLDSKSNWSETIHLLPFEGLRNWSDSHLLPLFGGSGTWLGLG